MTPKAATAFVDGWVKSGAFLPPPTLVNRMGMAARGALKSAPGAVASAVRAAPGATIDAIKSAPGAVANFGRRQAHAITGRGVNNMADAARIGLDPQHWRQGLTSIPGVAKGLVSHPTQTAESVAKATLNGGLAKIMFAAPLALSVPSLLRGDESATGGRSLTGKLVETVGQAGLGAVSAGLPLTTGFATSMIGAPLLSKATQHL